MDRVVAIPYEDASNRRGRAMAGHGEPKPMRAEASGALTGRAEVPGDKSVSHRALILGALAVGETRITGLLEGQDVLDTGRAMRAFGAMVERVGAGEWRVEGVGVGGFQEPDNVIDHGNSGTGVRLVMGAMATTDITATFTGDASLRGRPMGRITDPLALFGAEARGRRGGRLPITLTGAVNPMPVHYTTPVPSAQVKSAVLLAGLNAPGETVVIEKEPTRDHTERMLRGFGAQVTGETTAEGRVITLKGQPELRAQAIAVPRDPSSAAFPVAAALLVEGSEITLPGIGLNPTRAGIYTTLIEMGADIALREPARGGRRAGGGPAGAVLAAARHRGAAGAGAVDDRRIPDPRGAGRHRRRRDGDARDQGAAGQGERPDRRHGARARGLRHQGRGRARLSDRAWPRPGRGARRGDGAKPARPPDRHGVPLPRPGGAGADRGRRRGDDRHQLPGLRRADARASGRG